MTSTSSSLFFAQSYMFITALVSKHGITLVLNLTIFCIISQEAREAQSNVCERRLRILAIKGKEW